MLLPCLIFSEVPGVGWVLLGQGEYYDCISSGNGTTSWLKSPPVCLGVGPGTTEHQATGQQTVHYTQPFGIKLDIRRGLCC